MTIRIESKSKFCKLYKADIWGRLFILRKLTRFSRKWQPRQRTRISLGNFTGDLSKRARTYRRRRKRYGKRLAVRQKLLKFYGPLKERHFLKYLKTSRKKKGDIFSVLIKYLENRLDVVLYRSQFMRTIMHSRFNILHNKVWVNDLRINKPSYPVRHSDIITFSRPVSRKKFRVPKSIFGFCPEYLHVNWKTFKVNKYAHPKLDLLNFPFKLKSKRILEFYKT